MKRILLSMLFAAATAISAVPSFAQTSGPISTAEEDWLTYIKLDMGFSIGTTKFGQKGADEDEIAEIGGITNVALGWQKERSRFELAYQERASISELISTMLGITSSFEAFSFMANAYYDYVKSEHFAMYTGVGAGAARYHWQTAIWGQKANGRGWAFNGGFYNGMAFTGRHFAWDLGIDFYYIEKPETVSFVPKTGIRIIF